MDPTTIVKLASTVGLISTTSFWTMNLTINHLTFPALLIGAPPPPTTTTTTAQELSPRFLTPSTDAPQVPLPLLNRQWQEIYWHGHRWGPASALLSGAAFLAAAYFSPASGWSHARILYAVAAGAALSVWPWTVVVMQGGNDEMHRRGDMLGGEGGEGGWQEVEEKGKGGKLMTLIGSWLVWNEIRASLAVLGTVAGVAASLL